MVYYLRRMHYNIIDNITDTFGSTGIYAFSFVRLFHNVAQILGHDGEQNVKDYIDFLNSQKTVLEIICLLYLFTKSFGMLNDNVIMVMVYDDNLVSVCY